jgi:hypothetical protein
LWGYDVRLESVDETGHAETVGECKV